MFVVLPAKVSKIVDYCSAEVGRFAATTGVMVKDLDNGLWRLEATNGRFLCILHGIMPAIEFPIETVPNDCRSVVVPAKDWREVFSKNDGEWVAIDSDGSKITLHRIERLLPKRTVHTFVVEGRFPDVEQVVPNCIPSATIDVDPKMLATAVASLGAILADNGMAKVTFGLYPSGRSNILIGISGRRIDPDITADALIVPLVPTEKPVPAQANGQITHEDDATDTDSN